MRWLLLLGIALAAYLAGSVNWAVLVTRARTGRDIREMGNRNPGTANVGRSVGRGWGALVLLLDIAKALLPMLAARFLLFTGEDASAGEDVFSAAAVYVTAIAALSGHCRPVFFGFRGGGGVASSLAALFFFTPLEAAASLLVGGIVVAFLPRVAFRVGRWLPVVAITAAPFLVLAAQLLGPLPLTGWLGLGGHPWSVPAGVFAVSATVHAFNLRLVRDTLHRPGEKVERS
jgi:acyl phosphate:glycerol-3-phosphate acyltransferase